MSNALLKTPEINENLTPAVQQSLGISHDVIYQKVQEVVKTYGPENGQFLDFGAGQGDFLKGMLKGSFKFMYHGVDLMYSKVQGVNWYVQDLNKKLQFKDAQFDVISCIEVIEHLENPRQIIRDLARVLKPDGVLFFSTNFRKFRIRFPETDDKALVKETTAQTIPDDFRNKWIRK